MHSSRILAASLAVSLITAGPAFAIETLVKGAPASLTPLKTPQKGADLPIDIDPFTVRDVRVDQTGANPVKARELAIKTVPKLAFQKLVAQNLSPEQAAAFKYPDDKTIASLVQDFEIRNEQLSSTRYVANYTVRFSPSIKRYVDVKPVSATVVTTTRTTTVGNPTLNQPDDQKTVEKTVTTSVTGTDAAAATSIAPATPANAVIPQSLQKTLVLPYYEDMSGRTMLWEDENTWRQLWQSRAPRTAGNIEFVIPVGDLNDVASGSTDDVWSGNYKAIEKLANIYHVSDIVLPVANKSGPYLTIDMYFFKNGTLAGREVLQPYVSDQTEAEALNTGLQAVVEALQKKSTASAAPADQAVSSISQQLASSTAATTKTETVMTTAYATAVPADIDVAMRFSSMGDWTQFQRRLSSLTPSAVMDIKSISRDQASFRLRYSGDITALQTALQQKGILLEAPAVVVDTTQVGGSAARPLYSVQLLKQ